VSRIVVALDQGTTSTRAIAYDNALTLLASAQRPLVQHYPQPGWVEHDPLDIRDAAIDVLKEVFAAVGGAARVAAVGITNQRETVVGWHRADRAAIARAIVWQDRRTAQVCDALRNQHHEASVQAVTGLLLDPYFSASKMAWLLDHVPGAREAAPDLPGETGLLSHVPGAREAALAGRLAFGTIDSWLMANLCADAPHLTDSTNAARTALFDRMAMEWSGAMTRLFGVPASTLPSVRPSVGHFGVLRTDLFGAPVPVTAVLGDQHASLLGHGCISAGQAKMTFGTGGFLMVQCGAAARTSSRRLLSTLAWTQGAQTLHALEGSVFVAGAVVQWLHEGAELIGAPEQSEQRAKEVADAGGVTFVPAFTGLGAPWWDAHARGAILGLTRDTTGGQIVRAALEGIAHQTADLLDALSDDGMGNLESLRVDGGLSRNDVAMQVLADVCNLEVRRAPHAELTAQGVARAAIAGVDASVPSAGASVHDAVFLPSMTLEARAQARRRWTRGVEAVRHFGAPA